MSTWLVVTRGIHFILYSGQLRASTFSLLFLPAKTFESQNFQWMLQVCRGIYVLVFKKLTLSQDELQPKHST